MTTINLETLLKLVNTLGSGEAGDQGAIATRRAG